MKRESDMAEAPRVAFLVELDSEFGRDIACGVAGYIDQHGPWTILWDRMVDVPNLRGRKCRTALADVDGILAPFRDPGMADFIRAAGRPTVAVGSYALAGGMPAVMTDEAKIGRMVAEHFLSRGVRNFAYYDWPAADWPAVEMLRGRRGVFSDTIRAAGYAVSVFNSEDGPSGPRRWTRHKKALLRWLKDLPKPVGLMAVNDRVARYVVTVCNEGGIRIPEDVAIIGVDDETPICLLCNPPLSSVEHGAEQIGRQAAALLDRLMRGEALPSEPIHVPPVRIVERQSSDLLAVDDPDVAAAIRYIRDHIADCLQVGDVVNELATSRRSLEKAFRRRLNRTIHDEIVRTQIARAKDLLVSTDLSMPRVAAQCGFAYPSRLSASFKRHTGLTCTDYRRQFRVT